MAERLAALGIKAPTKPGETAAQRMERERAERAAKLRQAEEEDARREAERQARLAEETGAPAPAPTVQSPKADAKRPPPPPSRKGAKDDRKAEEDQQAAEAARKAEEERLQRERQEQQQATKELEYVFFTQLLYHEISPLTIHSTDDKLATRKMISQGSVRKPLLGLKPWKNRSRPVS
jgi:epidermal growth factor receptor substrate 15